MFLKYFLQKPQMFVNQRLKTQNETATCTKEYKPDHCITSFVAALS